MARLRAVEWGTEAYWLIRVTSYLDGTTSPGHALTARTAFVAIHDYTVAGFVAGHRTRRFRCDGELQWINIAPEWRRKSVASELLRKMAAWFAEQQALRVCVDVEPDNVPARNFYQRHGAEVMKPHWLVWPDIRVVLTAPSPPLR